MMAARTRERVWARAKARGGGKRKNVLFLLLVVDGGSEHALNHLALEGGGALDEGLLCVEAKGVPAPFLGDMEDGGIIVISDG